MISLPQKLAVLLCFAALIPTSSRLASAVERAIPPASLLFRELNYEGKVTDDEARFLVNLTVESNSKQELTQTLFEGDLAVLSPKLPATVQIDRTAEVDRANESHRALCA